MEPNTMTPTTAPPVARRGSLWPSTSCPPQGPCCRTVDTQNARPSALHHHPIPVVVPACQEGLTAPSCQPQSWTLPKRASTTSSTPRNGGWSGARLPLRHCQLRCPDRPKSGHFETHIIPKSYSTSAAETKAQPPTWTSETQWMTLWHTF